jgi:YVTN family beta-propeller protein
LTSRGTGGLAGEPSLSPDGRIAYVPLLQSHKLIILSFAARGIVGILSLASGGATAAARTQAVSDTAASVVGPDGRIYVINGTADTLQVVDPITNVVLATYHLHAHPISITLSGDGKLLVTSDDPSEVLTIDPTDGFVLSTTPINGVAGPLAGPQQNQGTSSNKNSGKGGTGNKGGNSQTTNLFDEPVFESSVPDTEDIPVGPAVVPTIVSPSATASATATATATATSGMPVTQEASATVSATSSATATSSPTLTNTPSPSVTPSATVRPVSNPGSAATSTNTSTPSDTSTSTATATPTATATFTGIYYVSGKSGSDSSNCQSLATACQTIAHALNLATNGNTINIAPGAYHELLTIGKQVILIGAGVGQTILDGQKSGTVLTLNSAVSLSGVSVQNGAGTGVGGGILLQPGSSLNLTNVAVTGSTATDGGGIYAGNGTTLTVTNSTISGNSASSGSGGGIISYGALVVNGSTISGNTAPTGGGIASYGTMKVSNSTIDGNTASASAGGISAAGTSSSIDSSTLSNNSATASTASGGGILVQTSLSLSNSTVSSNTAGGTGGGIGTSGTITVDSSNISGNTAQGTGGGGISIPSGGTATVINSTISGNTAPAGVGGGIYSVGTLVALSSTLAVNAAAITTIDSSTVARNSASTGSGIYNTSGIQIRNTIVSQNTCVGVGLTDAGYNLEYQGGGSPTCGFTNHAVNGDPLLAANLASNGGPTQTLALLTGSPAIVNGTCTTIAGSTNSVDQRGLPRPGTAGEPCDIGAFEAQTAAGFVTLSEFSLPSLGANAGAMVYNKGDGRYWFAEQGRPALGIIDPFLPPTALGYITELSLPNPLSRPFGITVGPDGNIWFTDRGTDSIGTVPATATAGSPVTVTECSVTATQLGQITTGPDNRLWFTDEGNPTNSQPGSIDALFPTTCGGTVPPRVSYYSGPLVSPFSITTGPDNNLWFTDLGQSKIGRISTSGAITTPLYSIPQITPTGAGYASWITAGSDGDLWFIEPGYVIGRMNTSGTVDNWELTPTQGSSFTTIPYATIVEGPSGTMWFTESDLNTFGFVNMSNFSNAANNGTSASITEYSLPDPTLASTYIASSLGGDLWMVQTQGSQSVLGHILLH